MSTIKSFLQISPSKLASQMPQLKDVFGKLMILRVPCGGTHVKSTKEVGFVALKRSRSGKGIERIEIKLVDDIV